MCMPNTGVVYYGLWYINSIDGLIVGITHRTAFNRPTMTLLLRVVLWFSTGFPWDFPRMVWDSHRFPRDPNGIPPGVRCDPALGCRGFPRNLTRKLPRGPTKNSVGRSVGTHGTPRDHMGCYSYFRTGIRILDIRCNGNSSSAPDSSDTS